MKSSTLGAFTLIEFMVVMTIMFMLAMLTYVPYAHHQKKVLLQQWAREVSQSLSEARNLALHGFDTWSGNLNIWLYFWSWSTQLEYYTSTGSIDIANLASATLYKSKNLPAGVEIQSVDGRGDNFLFVFERIKWDLTLTPSVTGEVDIDLSYKWATSSVLQSTVRYYPTSFISDY